MHSQGSGEVGEKTDRLGEKQNIWGKSNLLGEKQTGWGKTNRLGDRQVGGETHRWRRNRQADALIQLETSSG